jgi:hypothetical protein
MGTRKSGGRDGSHPRPGCATMRAVPPLRRLLAGPLLAAALAACASIGPPTPGVEEQQAEVVRIGPPQIPGVAVQGSEQGTPVCVAVCNGNSANTDYTAATTLGTVITVMSRQLGQRGYTVPATVSPVCAIVPWTDAQNRESPQVWCYFRATSAHWRTTVLARLADVDFTRIAPFVGTTQQVIPADLTPPLTSQVDLIEVRVENPPAASAQP